MEKLFKELLNDLGIDISTEQYETFVKYHQILVEWNEKMNLTAITDFDEVFIKHFYDSICLVKSVELKNQDLLDVGSGAGFPSIPLKILFPDLKVTIIDALQKRIRFLEVLTKELNLDVKLIHGRAEEFKRKHCYDIVTGRAVANLNMLSELCIPFVKIDGLFLAMKGQKAIEEFNNARSAIDLLGGAFVEDVSYQVSEQERHILVIKKINKTSPKYPRKFKAIKNSPL